MRDAIFDEGMSYDGEFESMHDNVKKRAFQGNCSITHGKSKSQTIKKVQWK